MSKKEYKMYSSRRKRGTRKWMELNPVFKETNRLKEILMLNEIKEVETSGQDLTQLASHLVERN